MDFRNSVKIDNRLERNFIRRHILPLKVSRVIPFGLRKLFYELPTNLRLGPISDTFRKKMMVIVISM